MFQPITNAHYKKDQKRYNYRFVLSSINNDADKYPRHSDGFLIELKNIKTGHCEYHPISDFLYEDTKIGLKPKTLRQYGLVVESFLNHVFIDFADHYQLNSLNELRFEHATSFLNYLLFIKKRKKSEKLASNQVDSIIRKKQRLINFIHYLARNYELKYISLDKFIVGYNQYGNQYILAPVKPEIARAKEEMSNQGSYAKVLHGLPFDKIPLFLRDTIKRKPELALAVYCGIFGGVRLGELCNTRHQDIIKSFGDQYGKAGFTLNLFDKPSMSGPKRNITNQGNVKKPREQRVYNINGMLEFLYKRHLKLLTKWYPDGNIDNSHALFINQHGKPFNDNTLTKAFNAVKEYFINIRLRVSADESDVQLAFNLERSKWAFHITRGMFSNIIAQSSKNPLDLMFARGDSSLLSCLPYIQGSGVTTEMIENTLNRIDQKFINFGSFKVMEEGDG